MSEKRQFGPNICTVCGHEFYPLTRNSYDAKKIKACSKKCRTHLFKQSSSKPRKKGRFFVCKNCGQEFRTYPSRIKKVFCCKKCCHEYWKKKRVTKICKGCGKEFVLPYTGSIRKFCSQECYLGCIHGKNNPNWAGGRDCYYGTDWSQQSEKARERDNYTCQICGLKQENNYRALDVHHIVPFKKFSLKNHEQANKLDNLITLCSPCHIRLENGSD